MALHSFKFVKMVKIVESQPSKSIKMDFQRQGITGRTNPRGHFCEQHDDVGGLTCLTQMRGQSRRLWPILDGDCIRDRKLCQALGSLSCALQSQAEPLHFLSQPYFSLQVMGSSKANRFLGR